jgi:hypothetical protein
MFVAIIKLFQKYGAMITNHYGIVSMSTAMIKELISSIEEPT